MITEKAYRKIYLVGDPTWLTADVASDVRHHLAEVRGRAGLHRMHLLQNCRRIVILH